MLHDIGHYPFSHIGENIFGDIKSKLLPIFPNIIKILPKHEARTANIILGKDIFIELKEFHGLDLNPNNYFKKIFKIINSFEDEKIKIDNVATLIEGLRINNHDIGHLINGPIDVDKMDYILREAYFTGTPFGNIDIHRIIQGYLIRNIKKEGNTFKNQLVFNKRMLTSILQMYVGREFNYSRISYHRTLRIAETTLKAILDITVEELKNIVPDEELEEVLKQVFFHFKLMEDRDFLHFLEIMIQLSPNAANLFNRLITRTLYKRVDYIDSISLKDLRYLEPIGESNQSLSLYLPARVLDIFKDKDKLSPLFNAIWDRIPSSIKEKLNKLNELMQKHENEVILLNAFNYPLSIELIKENIKKIMKNIFIDEGEKPGIAISLVEQGEKLSEFLTDIHNTNSNIIFAFENSIIGEVQKLGIFNDTEFIECFILLILAYNNII